MALKKKSGGGEGGANWMDTYGDMVTLLLCFFVLLYSMSTIDQEKWMLIVQSFNRTAEVSTDDTPRGPEGDGDLELGAGMPTTTELDSAMDELYEFLQTYAASANAASSSEDGAVITVSQGDGYVYVAFNNALFFDGDRWALRAEGQEILNNILPALEAAAPVVDEIRVSGHTASALGSYDAEWDFQLSTMRAVEVVAYLLENSNELDPARIQPMGYGQWRPVAGNSAESDRSQNRRVEMMITGKDIENALGDSVAQYYSTTQQTQPGVG
ncbi:MAG: OmpA family protein [Oscillospiraceae bacterium]|jgi:chemotaxis protein MotB|nr:OmpA family protein [Oscillospiraceae bacterium]